jgi:hypothetical protein
VSQAGAVVLLETVRAVGLDRDQVLPQGPLRERVPGATSHG